MTRRQTGSVSGAGLRLGMALAMLLGMGLGMVVHVAVGIVLTPILGMFQVMVTGSLIGILRMMTSLLPYALAVLLQRFAQEPSGG